jgi:FtsP/CotA-like multicopper oxidase with cupredoxin domain
MFNTVLAAHPTRGGVRLYTAALLTLGAAAIHFAVAPEHLGEYPLFGVFFLVLGSAQGLLALELLVRPSRRLAVLGAVTGLSAVAVWVVSRTTGVPIGPAPWTPEDVGLADSVCSAMEVASALLLLVVAARPLTPRPRRPWTLALATVPSVLLVLALAGTGVAAAANEMPLAVSAAPAVPGRPSTSVASLTEAPGSERVERFTLTAEVGQVDGHEAWTFNGSAPGPELRVTQGDRVQVTLINHLPVATTIHWHGMRLPNAEDGVAGITQDAVPPGQSFTYEFVARDAGTYWYHSHQNTEEQIGRGLFGALVVEPPAGHVAEDRDYTLVFHSADAGHGVAINGVTGDLQLAARSGERVRLRLIDAVAPDMDGGPQTPVLFGAPYEVVALDGHDLNAPQLLGPERLPLGMGQRAGLVFTMPPSGAVRLLDGQLKGQPSALERVSPSASAAATVTIGDGQPPTATDPQLVPVFDATTYGAPVPDPVASAPSDATYPIVLDKHPGFRDGRPELLHTINGQPSPDVPPIEVQPGQVVRLHIVNDSGEYHPMHLHGHVMSVLARNGQPIEGSPLHLDTVLIGPDETWDVAFAADNPGIWMFHCHVLLHAASGMSLTVNYADVATPFEMGTRSGNVPE